MKIAVCFPSFELPKNVKTLDSLWDVMLDAQSCITNNIPRYSTDDFSIKDKDKPFFKTFGAIGSVADFDANYFKFTELEARSTDPQHRLLLKHAAIALENAGYPVFKREALNCGVYVGICSSDYGDLLRHYHIPFVNNPYFAIGNTHSTATGRISRLFNLKGPSIAYDTACSSSGVALHSAIQGIKNGDCDIALVAATNLILSPIATGAFMAARMLSPSMSCKPFSKKADGYIRSEAVIAMVIKPLDVALQDGSEIYCIIESTNVNQDGYTPEITSPNIQSQSECLSSAISMAELDPTDISYAEAHGTGTQVGDSAEISSFNEVFEQSNNTYIGSSKSIFGHTETCASLVGLVYAAEIIRRKTIPVFPVNPGERRSDEFTSLRFADAATSISTTKAYASISGYGYSGTNFSCVISNIPQDKPQREIGSSGVLYTSGYNQKHIDHQLQLLQHQEMDNDYIQRINLRSLYFPNRAVVDVTQGYIQTKSTTYSLSSVSETPVFLYINSSESIDLETLFSGLPNDFQYLNDGYQELTNNKLYSNIDPDKKMVVDRFLLFIGMFATLTDLGLRIEGSFISIPQDPSYLKGVPGFNILFNQLLKTELGINAFDEFQKYLTSFKDHTIEPQYTAPMFSDNTIVISATNYSHINSDHVTEFVFEQYARSPVTLINKLYLSGSTLLLTKPRSQPISLFSPYLESEYWFDNSKLKGNIKVCGAYTPVSFTDTDRLELVDHTISGRAIVPFSFYMTKALLSTKDVDPDYPICLDNLTIHEALIQYSNQLQYKMSIEHDLVSIYRTADNQDALVFSATKSKTDIDEEALNLNNLKPLGFSPSELYDILQRLDIVPGESLKKVSELFSYQDSDIVALITAETLNSVIDTAFQICSLPFREYASEFVCSSYVYLPSSVKQLVVYNDDAPSFVRVKPIQTKLNEIIFNFAFYGKTGNCAFTMNAVRVLKHSISPANYPDIYLPKVEEKPIQNELQANIPSNINTILITDKQELVTGESGFTYNLNLDITELIKLMSTPIVNDRPSALCFVIPERLDPSDICNVLNELVIAITSLNNNMLMTLEVVSLNQYSSTEKRGSVSTFGLLKGYTLSLSLEFPALNIKYVDISGFVNQDWLSTALGELQAFSNTIENPDPVAMYNHRTRYTLSLERAKKHSSLLPFFESELNSQTSRPNLFLEQQSDSTDEAIKIRVFSSGINFRDLLVVNNKYTPKRKGLGTDFFGQVIRDKEGNYSPGDFVFGISSHAFSSVISVPSNQVVKVPDGLEKLSLSAFPLVFLSTVIPIDIYLKEMVGKNVLIHNASGGLGLTLCQYFKANGARIYATTHGITKQNYLRDIGISDIADSRQKHAYFDNVKLDVAFYTLQSSLLDLTLSSLKDGATVIDYTLDAKANRKKVASDNPSVRYIPFNLEEYLDNYPEALEQYLPTLFDTDISNCIPVRNWMVAQSLDAFNAIEKAQYIGKNIIQWPIPTEKPTILVSGGGGDFSRFLIDSYNSGFNYVLFGRRSETILDQSIRNKIDGQRIQYFKADVTNLSELINIKALLVEQGRNVVRIYHFAGALLNASINDTNISDFNSLYNVKYHGARNLETVFDSPHLQEFVLASSISALLGSPGQTAYAGASGALESFCKERTSRGLRTKLIYFPPIQNTQMVESMGQLSMKVFPQVGSDDFTLLLERALKHPDSMVSYFEFNNESYNRLPKAQQFLLSNFTNKNNSHNDKSQASENEENIRKILALETEEEQFDEVFRLLSEIIQTTMEGPDAQEYNSREPLSEQGIDSLSIVEISTLIEDRFNLRFTADAFNKETSIFSMAMLVKNALIEQKDA